MSQTITPTLRLQERLIEALRHTPHNSKAADLRAVIQADPRVDLVTVAQVSGLSGVPIPHLFREDAA